MYIHSNQSQLHKTKCKKTLLNVNKRKDAIMGSSKQQKRSLPSIFILKRSATESQHFDHRKDANGFRRIHVTAVSTCNCFAPQEASNKKFYAVSYFCV